MTIFSVEGGGYFCESCLCLQIQEQYTLEQYYNNKSLNHATLSHVVHYATLQNTELTIYQETIQLAQIKIKFFQ